MEKETHAHWLKRAVSLPHQAKEEPLEGLVQNVTWFQLRSGSICGQYNRSANTQENDMLRSCLKILAKACLLLLSPQQPVTATAEHIYAPILAGCRRIRQYAFEYHLTDRPHTMLWLLASMCACQISGTRCLKEGDEMDCPLQTVHLCLLKHILGVKHITSKWFVLWECGKEKKNYAGRLDSPYIN
eukprot:1150266-Pelagomonas_calceolata.AAC.1